MDQAGNKPMKKVGHVDSSLPACLTATIGTPEFDRNKSTLGLCLDMCPLSEIKERGRSRIHLLEGKFVLTDSSVSDHILRGYFIKELKRSSADTHLNDPSLIRPVHILLRTVRYIQNELMEQDLRLVADPRFGVIPRTIEVYLFIFNRYRMIVKDLAMQRNEINVENDRYCIECLECIIRYHIMMDFQLKGNQDYEFEGDSRAGNAHQNLEQLNNCLKMLVSSGLYQDARKRKRRSTDSIQVMCPNEAEFCAYYILAKLEKPHREFLFSDQEVSRYIASLDSELLLSEEIQFAFAVVTSIKTRNYFKFFRLFHEATYLEACLMNNCAKNMRLEAMDIICRTGHMKNKDNKPTLYSLSDLTDILAFDDVEGTRLFLEKCKFSVSSVPINSECINDSNIRLYVHIDGQPHVYIESTADESPHLKISSGLIDLKLNSPEGILSRRDIVSGRSSRRAVPLITTDEEDEEFYRNQQKSSTEKMFS